MFIFYHYNVFGIYFRFFDILILGIIYGGVSQFGDFGESLLKREAGIKDSSNFLKGHGGILDRFDSMTIAAPLTLLYIVYYM